MNTNILQTLVTAMQRRLAALPQRLRPFTTEFDELPKNLMLTGARGCGKSTFLLHHSQGRRLLYFSADNPKIIGEPLYDLVSSVFMLGYEGVIIDERKLTPDRRILVLDDRTVEIYRYYHLFNSQFSILNYKRAGPPDGRSGIC